MIRIVFLVCMVHMVALFGAPDVSRTKDLSAKGDNHKRVKKVLVVAPHPDDDIIGCGGSIAKHRKNGHEISVVYMTSGDLGIFQRPREEVMRIREREATNAEQILGVNSLYFLRNPDGNLLNDSQPLLQLVEIIRKEQPDIVYIPHHVDAHNDHIVTHELAVEAIKKSASRCFSACKGDPWRVSIILCYEVWTPLQEVSYSEDISEFIEIKLQALRQHASQLSTIRYDNAIEGLNRYRGPMTKIGKYGEVFQVLKISYEVLSPLIQE